MTKRKPHPDDQLVDNVRALMQDGRPRTVDDVAIRLRVDPDEAKRALVYLARARFMANVSGRTGVKCYQLREVAA